MGASHEPVGDFERFWNCLGFPVRFKRTPEAFREYPRSLLEPSGSPWEFPIASGTFQGAPKGFPGRLPAALESSQGLLELFGSSGGEHPDVGALPNPWVHGVLVPIQELHTSENENPISEVRCALLKMRTGMVSYCFTLCAF